MRHGAANILGILRLLLSRVAPSEFAQDDRSYRWTLWPEEGRALILVSTVGAAKTKTCHSEAEPGFLHHNSDLFAARQRNLLRGSYGSRSWWPLRAAG